MEMLFRSFLRRLLPGGIRSHRILAGPLRGRQIVTSWHDYPAAILGRTEKPLLAWFLEHVGPGATWLDVGAHYGYTAIALCLCVGPSGRVFAFEPLVSTAGHIEHTRRLNGLGQLRVVPLGLASPEAIEIQELPDTRGMLDATLIEAAGEGEHTLGERADVVEGWSTALFASLDWVWPRLCQGREQIDGIKIDVQGMEIEALRGMLGTLRRLRPVLIVELHRGVDRTQFLRLLDEVGYTTEPVPIETRPGGTGAMKLLDNQSYLFHPA